MKKITEHLGELIVALAGVCLLISIIVLFKAPIGNFFDAIFDTEVSAGNKVVGGIVLDPDDVIFTEPPATDPPVTNPPVTDPPVTEHSHAFGSWQKVDDTDHSRSCTCGASETEAHDFNFVENGDGTKTGTCSKCNHSITVESDVHVCAFGQWTDNGNGTHSRSCFCGAKETEEHSYGTGSGDGENYHELYCDDCDYTGWEECEFEYVYDNRDGTHQIECKYCYNGWAEDHTLTWTDNGNGTHREKCTVCDYSQSQAHSYEYEVTVHPTEEAEGEKTGTCKCGHQVTETIDKLPPSHSHNYSAWDYNSEKHWKACSCGDTTTPVSHTFDEGVTTIEATCTDAGEILKTCTECGYEKTEEIAALGHDFTHTRCDTEHECSWTAECAGGDGSVHQWTSFYHSLCSRCDAVESRQYWCGTPEHFAYWTDVEPCPYK